MSATPINPSEQAGDPLDFLTGNEESDALVRLAVERGFATDEEVRVAVRLSESTGGSLDDSLVEAGALTRGQLVRLRDLAEAAASGRQIPGYRMLGEIGRGSMAAVFKARQESLDRVVAIKVLPRKKALDEKVVKQFQAEGRLAAKLNHPNIVHAFDVGRVGNHHYFVMEYVEGSTIYEAVRERQRFTEAETLDVGIAMADALSHAHAQGLVHRDVKPKNILLTLTNVPKLLDLGLARLVTDEERAQAEEGRTLGTPYYISPEQIRGDLEIGPEADIYALGATMFTMITGSVPYPAKNLDEALAGHMEAPVPKASERLPGVAEGVSEVLEKMLQKNPADRYRTCEELLLELRAWQAVANLREGERAG